MALLTAENVVRGVEVRKIKAGTPDEKTVYDIVDREGVKWTAWERQLAEQAYSLKDVDSVWKVTVEQNGSYTNRTLKEIAPKAVTGYAPALGAMEASLGGNSPQTHSWTPGTVEPTNGMVFKEAVVEEPSYKDRHIWRQTATKVAATLGGTQDEFWQNVAVLIQFYETGVNTEKGVQEEGAPTGLAYEQPPPLADNDIPF